MLVYVYNIVEDEWAFINYLGDPRKRLEEIERCEETTDCFFLSMATEQDFVFISPKPISTAFQQYAKELFGFREAEIITPQKKSHMICEDLLSDTKAISQLVEKAKDFKRVTLISYSATEEFYKLRETLIDLGLNVYTPEAPEIDSAWTVNFFGSKSGIRQLAQQSKAIEPDFVMPEGTICVGKRDASKIAANKYMKQKGVVIKTNKGSGGSGVLIFHEEELPTSYLECESAILKSFNSDTYWDHFPIVVEDLVNINYAIGGGFPSIEFKIQKNGRIDMLYYCCMTVTDKGQYLGLDINDDLVSDRVLARIIDTGYFIAEQYGAAGYRGHFDIDMIAAKNNQIYVSESNTRNSGGTDVYRISQKLLGKEFWENHYVLSRSRSRLHETTKWTFEKMLDKLNPLLYSKSSQEGVIINSENDLLMNELIFTIIGKNRRRVYEIEREMKESVGADS